MKRLRIELCCKCDDVFARRRDAAQFPHLTYAHVFPKNSDFTHARPPATFKVVPVT